MTPATRLAARTTVALAPLLLALATAPEASAQTAALMPGITVQGPGAVLPSQLSVGERPQSDYSPLGQRFGSFILLPTLDVAPMYNSNVFVTETGAVSDYGVGITPTVTAQSDWGTDALNFLVSGNFQRWEEHGSNNQNNMTVATNGRLDILNNVYMTGALGYSIQHEARTAPSTVTAQEFPTEYQLVSGRLGFVHDVGILGLRIDGGADLYQYDNNIIANGLPFNCSAVAATSCVVETDRNRLELGVTPRLTYQIVPGYSAFIQVPVNARIYQSKLSAALAAVPGNALPIDQDSHGYEVDVGTQFSIDPVINGNLYVGYQEQDYDSSAFVSPQEVAFGGNVLWNPTLLTSVNLNLSRTVEETTIRPASSYVQSQVAVNLEHELLRQLLLTGGGSFADQDYQGIVRDDHVYSGTIGTRYLMNRNINANLTATYQTRLSNVAPNSYHQIVVLLDVRFQY